jgi:hypothetical protein
MLQASRSALIENASLSNTRTIKSQSASSHQLKSPSRAFSQMADPRDLVELRDVGGRIDCCATLPLAGARDRGVGVRHAPVFAREVG